MVATAVNPRMTSRYSLDHLVGACEKYVRHFEAKRLCGLEVDHQLEPGRLLDRQVGRLFAFDDLVHMGRGARVDRTEVDAA